MSKNLINILLLTLVISSVFISCSTTKHLKEGELLYTGTRKVLYEKVGDNTEEWKINDFAEKSTDVVMTLWESPNGAFLGVPYAMIFPLRLYIYNWFYTEQEKGLSRWMMENFGEPPLTISDLSPEMRVKSIENELFNRGHFGVRGSYQLKIKDNRKASVKYNFKIPKAHRYRSVEMKLDSAHEILRPAINEYMQNSKIVTGEDFNLDDISDEKKLLWDYLQNKGYYFLKQNHILILADTTVGNKQVDLQYRIDRSLTSNQLKKLKIENKNLFIDSKKIDFTNGKAYSGKGVEVNERLINKIIEIREDSIFSLEDKRKTLRNISGVGMFPVSFISYRQNNDSTKLIADIDLKTVNLFTLGVSGNVTQKNTGFVGPGIEMFANQRNLWGSAENFNLLVNGYLDFPFGVLSERTSRSSGFSATASLSAPVLRSPVKLIEKNAILLPQRSVSLGFELNNRADYFTITEWKGSYDLSWFTRPKISHKLGIVNINYSNLLKQTPAFDSLVSESEIVRNSFSNKFISGPSYTFTYNNTAGQYKRFKSYFQANIELAGNILDAAYRISGNDEKNKKILGVEFSQYIRFTTDFRAYLRLGERNTQLAFRNILGIGKAYGNSDHMPYVKQFYIGGNNSLRPISARVLGPGRYLEFDEKSINQVGDFKFETNIELRFRIAYIIYGAIWSDLGNIWLLKEDPERPLSGIRFNKLLRDSYWTSGIGLRADLDFLVVRADYGAVLHLPFLMGDSRWIWNNNLPLYGLVFGIGYPF